MVDCNVIYWYDVVSFGELLLDESNLDTEAMLNGKTFDCGSAAIAEWHVNNTE